MRSRGHKGTELPPDSALTVTVPGAAALWEDVTKTFGSLPLAQVCVLGKITGLWDAHSAL